MGKYSKLRQKILAGGADSNVAFTALCQLLIRLGFDERINLQPVGSKAKAYQVKQVRDILVKYRLGESDVD